MQRLPTSMHNAMNSIPNKGAKKEREQTKTNTQKYLPPSKQKAKRNRNKQVGKPLKHTPLAFKRNGEGLARVRSG